MGGEPAFKRLRTTSGGNDLVAQVKAFQKEGEGQKNAWHHFCDVQMNGIRDPSRHDNATLQNFLKSNGNAAARTVAKPSMRPNGNVNSHHVAKIKAYQKQGPEEKENWHEFAD